MGCSLLSSPILRCNNDNLGLDVTYSISIDFHCGKLRIGFYFFYLFVVIGHVFITVWLSVRWQSCDKWSWTIFDLSVYISTMKRWYNIIFKLCKVVLVYRNHNYNISLCCSWPRRCYKIGETYQYIINSSLIYLVLFSLNDTNYNLRDGRWPSLSRKISAPISC